MGTIVSYDCMREDRVINTQQIIAKPVDKAEPNSISTESPIKANTENAPVPNGDSNNPNSGNQSEDLSTKIDPEWRKKVKSEYLKDKERVPTGAFHLCESYSEDENNEATKGKRALLKKYEHVDSEGNIQPHCSKAKADNSENQTVPNLEEESGIGLSMSETSSPPETSNTQTSYNYRMESDPDKTKSLERENTVEEETDSQLSLVKIVKKLCDHSKCHDGHCMVREEIEREEEETGEEGDANKTLKLHQEAKLLGMVNYSAPADMVTYDYDLVVVGGGSGGLAASKEAADMGAKVALLDYVVPTPLGTTWGLGGTCVNVGCIPKKLMHQAGLHGHGMDDAKSFGWDVPEKVAHSWDTMKDNIQAYIGSLNWGYRVQLRSRSVSYINSYGEILDPHRVKATNRKGVSQELTTKYIVIATGARPRYPDVPGAREYCITSDDLFSLPYSPGKTLVIGGSYVALESAGFMVSIGLDVTCMVRSIFLRGFDQQCANRIGEYMAKEGCKFVKGFVPTKIEQIEEGSPGRLRVYAKSVTDSKEIVDEYNTVLIAIGRDACTKNVGLEKLGINMEPVSGKLICHQETTNVRNIFAVGDIVVGELELTPLAIQQGRLLARRLFGSSKVQTDYRLIPTTVFTPLEYGCCGYPEEDAVKEFGEDNIEVYHSNFMPLEWTVPKKGENTCYAKLVCLKSENERVIGFHVLGPNAGELTQGFALAMKLGATKADFDGCIGIHPTCAEIYTMLQVTKRSGLSIEVAGC